MKVSIVTPSYNQVQYIEQTINSVLSQQTSHEIEYIIIDGGSRDGSVELIEKYASKLFYWVSEPDKGQSDAIAKGFEKATGDVLAWLNSDDVLALNAVETAIDYLIRNPMVGMVYGNRLAVNASGQILYYKRMFPVGANSVFVSMILGQESCFWRKNIYEEVGGINPSRNFAMDYELFSKFAQISTISYCGNLWAAFRIHDDSRTVNEYSTIGKMDVETIQREVWGKIPGRLRWQVTSIFIKIWGLSGMLLFQKPLFPSQLINKAKLTLKERVHGSFHKGSLINKLLK